MYTQSDLDDVRRGIAALARGERVTQIRAANGKTWTFQQATLAELREIENLMLRSLNETANVPRRSRTRRVYGRKGL